jgi:hypothetical protein
MSKSAKSAYFRHVFDNNFFGTFFKNFFNGFEISVKFCVFLYPYSLSRVPGVSFAQHFNPPHEKINWARHYTVPTKPIPKIVSIEFKKLYLKRL